MTLGAKSTATPECMSKEYGRDQTRFSVYEVLHGEEEIPF